ncbi:MAG: L,D-transpeptidase family protein [Rhizobiaceae bacterium]
MKSNLLRAGLIVAALALAGCTDASLQDISPKAEKGLPAHITKAMHEKGMTRNSPVLARIFKEEGKFEVWKQKTNGRYDLIASYDICKWSGQLGPKFIEGDRQAPEGFYTVRPAQMNPKSNYHLAFNIGYPNAFDRAHGRTGAHLMVHGDCSSSGCYSMNNAQMEQIYAFARDAFRGGQTEFQIQAFPFRMTAANMARYEGDPNIRFWRMLKEGYDHFELSKVPPKVDVCEKRYVFNQFTEEGVSFSATGACPPATRPSALMSAFEELQAKEAGMPAGGGNGVALTPRDSINGLEEARLVSEWTRKRARGERVTMEPPAMLSDGSTRVTSRMGRIDSEAGRRMAALDAAEAEKKRAQEEKARAAEQRAMAAAQAEAEAAAAVKAAEVAAQGGETATTDAGAPEGQGDGLLGGARKRLSNLFGS